MPCARSPDHKTRQRCEYDVTSAHAGSLPENAPYDGSPETGRSTAKTRPVRPQCGHSGSAGTHKTLRTTPARKTTASPPCIRPYDLSAESAAQTPCVRRHHGRNLQPQPLVGALRCQPGYSATNYNASPVITTKPLRAKFEQKYRGRDAGCPAPPSQIPACVFLAPGSSRQLASHEHTVTRELADMEAPRCVEAGWPSVGSEHRIRPMCSSAFGCAD